MKINDLLNEGPHDPHIFKAIFLAGGPGSGKSYVANKLFTGTGLKMINSDIIYEYVMKKRGLPMDADSVFSPIGQDTREYAKGISVRKEKSHIDGRLGMILDGTGKDLNKYRMTKQMLEGMGYETIMVFVNTSLEVAQRRNRGRERQIAPEQVEKMWRNVQENMMQFQQLFGVGHFYIVDSTNGVDNNPNFAQLQKSINKFVDAPTRNRNAIAWLNAQKAPTAVEEDAPVAARPLTQADLSKLEFYADKLFKTIGIDINFSRHFLDRVNDERNQKQITLPELALLFRDEFRKWGKKIASMGPDSQAVMKDMRSDVNVPFVLNWNRGSQELDLVAKTVMRKRGFTSPDPILAVEAKQKPAPGAQVKGREAAKKSKAGEHSFAGRLVGETNVNELKIFKPAPEHTMGVDRKDMPQISEKDYPELFRYLAKHGGKVSTERVNPRSLHPIQKEFSDEGVLRTMTSGKMDKPVIASSDDYIIDGHHRWLAAANTHHMLTINRVSLPVTELLALINSFSKVSYKDIWNE